MTSIEVRRTGEHAFVATNDRGGEVAIGRVGMPDSFSPVELLLAAAAGCVAVTGESLVVRRAGEVDMRAVATDVRPAGAHQLDGVEIGLDLDLSGLDAEHQAQVRAVVEHAIEALCTVTRTLERAATTTLTIP